LAPTLESSGTVTVAVIGTPETLRDVNTPGTYTLAVDTNAMQAGDVLELRVYEIVLTAGTRRVFAYGQWADVQPTDDKIKKSIPVDSELTDSGSVRFEINQLRGTARAFPWKVLKHA